VAKIYIFIVILPFSMEHERREHIVLVIHNLSNSIAVPLLYLRVKSVLYRVDRMLVDSGAIMDGGVNKFPSLPEIEPQATRYYRTFKIF